MWPDLPKTVLCTHSFKTHLSSPSVSYINAPICTACVFITAEGWTICFLSGIFLKPVWHPRVLGWPLIGRIFSRQADSRLWITTQLADELSMDLINLLLYRCTYIDNDKVWTIKITFTKVIWGSDGDLHHLPRFSCLICVTCGGRKMAPMEHIKQFKNSLVASLSYYYKRIM